MTTPPPLDDLRTRILVAISKVLTDSSGRLAPTHIAETGAAVRDTRDAVLAVVQPELDRLAADNQQLRQQLAEARGHAELFARKLTAALDAR